MPGVPRPHVILTFSIGGGTGRSEIGASIAYGLAQRGRRVWLIDGNLFAPVLDLIFGCECCVPTLSDYLAGSVPGIPTNDLSKTILDAGGRLFLTPSSRDKAVRKQLEPVLEDADVLAERLPAGILTRAQDEQVDVIVIDSVPSFEPINKVWLALTDLLLIISRANALDIELLRTVLNEETVDDVTRKMIVFNNLELDACRCPRTAMETAKYQQRVADLIQRHQKGTLFHSTGANKESGAIEIYPDPVPYSEALAAHDRCQGLFMRHEPASPFAIHMDHLVDVILSRIESHAQRQQQR